MMTFGAWRSSLTGIERSADRMNWLFSHPPTPLAALLVLAGKATLLLILVSIIRLVIHSASASARYFVIGTGIIMIGCLPVITLVTPDWKLPVPTAIRSNVILDGNSPSSSRILHGISQSGPAAETNMNGSHAPVATASGNPLFYLWMLGTVAAMGRVLAGLTGSTRGRHRGLKCNSARVNELVRIASGRIGLRRNISIQVGGRLEVPHISGIINPVLRLPRNALNWPDERLTSVLLHELAHIKRRDHIFWPLANLSVSWLWFNPLAWLALARMRSDKEKACDDYVLACGRNRADYAKHLLDTCLSIGAPANAVSPGLQFAQKNEVRERIMYMLNREVDRRPISRARQFAYVCLLLVLLIPLTGTSGIATGPGSGGEVQPGERDTAVETLKSFFAALSSGSDFRTIDEEFLTSDYFDDASLTPENLDKAVWLQVFENSLCCITEGRAGIVQKVRGRLTSLEHRGDELIATLQMDIIGLCLNKGKAHRDADGNVSFVIDKTSGKETAVRECPVVDSLSQQVRLRREDNAWKISQFKGGLTIMRMDTKNPYGPIFLVWIENIDDHTTPLGSRVFKVIPRDIVPDAYNAEFSLEE